MTVYTDDEIRHHREEALTMLLKLGPDKFDMSTWARNDEYPGGADLEDLRHVDLTSCGTTACLAGTALYAFAQAGIEIPDLANRGSDVVADMLGISNDWFYSWLTE